MHKPGLTAHTLRRYLIASAVTMALVTVGLLLLTDYLTLRAAGGTLLREIRAAAPDETTLVGCGPMMGAGRRGQAMLNQQGCPLNGPMADRCTPWAAATQIYAAGEGCGIGRLPWLPGEVVWAARAQSVDGTPRLLVAWNRVEAIRAATGVTYGLVLLSTLLAFLVGLGLMLHTTRSVSRVIEAVSVSGARMAAGDFQVRLPEQPTAELDRLARVISELAQGLDSTLGDLRAEHQRLIGLEGLQRQFVADASHELRAPLARIALMLASWRDGLLAPEEQADTLAHLRAETARLSALVERLLDLSCIESGRELVAPMPLAPRPALEAVAAAFRGQPGAPIGIEAPDDLPAALADPDAIHRMLHNLLENARRFTPETGRITLWATATEDGVRLGVTDTGSGIAPEELARIWDRFARSPQARADGTTGSGLGLAIVKALAEAHGGQVGAESTPGVETTIWVQLPRADGKIEPEATPG